MVNPEFAREIGIGIGVLAPAVSAVIIRLRNHSKIVGEIKGEQGKGNVRAKKLVSKSDDQFVFVPTAGNAEFTVETHGEEQSVHAHDYYPGEMHDGWACIEVEGQQDFALRESQINRRKVIPGLHDAWAIYTGTEGMNKDLLAQMKTTLWLEERN
jgi:hypothetical protein